MNRKRYSGYLIGALIVLIGLYIIVAYNSLVKKENEVNRTWSEVQSTYQRRLDLTQNLVNVVKGISDFEQGTLTQIAEARSKALGVVGGEPTAANVQSQTVAQNQLSAASNRLIVVVEKYPQLKGTTAYSGLQTQLEGNERRIKVARNDFNTAIADYNNSVRGFPKSLVAKMFRFDEKQGFQSDAGADKNIEIKF
ncbi:MAG: LemA family protein [Sphingobacteriales bacterium 41-5]|nr:MAG: LemA family protein [Niabella sp. SCN 42-15]OJU26450.1 MAG: LemA family protein [Sphingobacteriales bacterium 41-5]